MNNQNLLDPIWTSYQTTIDCLKIASILRRTIVSVGFAGLRSVDRISKWCA